MKPNFKPNNHQNLSFYNTFWQSYTNKAFGHKISNPLTVKIGLVSFVDMLTDFIFWQNFLVM